MISGRLAHRIRGYLQRILSYMEMETGEFPWLERAKKEISDLSTLIGSHIKDLEGEEAHIHKLEAEIRELKSEIRDLKSNLSRGESL